MKKSINAWMAFWGLEWVAGREQHTVSEFTEFQARMFLECERAHGNVVTTTDRMVDALYDDYVAQGGAVA